MVSEQNQMKGWVLVVIAVLWTAQGCKNEEVMAKPILLAELSTTPVTNVTSNSPSTGGTVASDGGSPVTERGVCWFYGTKGDPTIADGIADWRGGRITAGSGLGDF